MSRAAIPAANPKHHFPAPDPHLEPTGGDPRRSIGSANLAEFFVTVAISVTFLFHLNFAEYGGIVLGLVIGGAIAAPLAGYLIRIMPQKVALCLVGIVVSSQAVVSIYGLFSA